MNDSVLSASNIDFKYSRGDHVLKGFSFDLKQGDMVGLIGPNGAGKSTVLKILSGYLQPDSGEILVGGKRLRLLKAVERARKIGVVAQNVFTPLPFTVRQVVEMGRAVRVSRFVAMSSEDRERVESAMDSMDVKQFEHKRFNSLSGGEMQRVMIAAALAQEPDIILLDEPTSQLDMGHAVDLMKLLKKLNKENDLSIIIVSHDIQLMSSALARLTIIQGGKVVVDGTPAGILKEELIESVYHCRVKILRDEKDRIHLVNMDL